MFLFRIPMLFLLFKLSAALKISIQPTVVAGKDTPLNWTRQSSDPQSFKFSLNVTSVSGLGENSGRLLKTVDTNGKNQDSVNINILMPGRYRILAFLSDSSDSNSGPKQQQDPTTDPFDVAPLRVLISRGVTTDNDASSAPVTTIFNPSTFDAGAETITTFPTSVGGTETGLPVSSRSFETIPATATSRTPSKSTSSVPIIIGSLFGAIFTVGVLSLCCFVLFRRCRGGLRNPRYSCANEPPHIKHRIDPYTLKPAFVPSPPVTATKRDPVSALPPRPTRRVGTNELAGRVSNPVLPLPTVSATRLAQAGYVSSGELAIRVNNLSRQVERLQSWVIPPAYEGQ